MQHVHSKDHDINCIVFPQNDPWEHAATQLRVWHGTLATLELRCGQVALPTTNKRLPTKFGRPGSVFGCNKIAEKIYGTIWNSKKLYLYKTSWCISKGKALQSVEESLLEITWTVDYVWRLAIGQSHPLQVKLNSLPNLRPQTVKILLEWKCSLNSAAKHLAKPFPLWGPGWWSQTPRDAFPTTQYGIDDKVASTGSRKHLPTRLSTKLTRSIQSRDITYKHKMHAAGIWQSTQPMQTLNKQFFNLQAALPSWFFPTPYQLFIEWHQRRWRPERGMHPPRYCWCPPQIA